MPTTQPQGGVTQSSLDKTKKFFSTGAILLPILIGVGVIVLMFVHDAEKVDLRKVFDSFTFNLRSVLCIILAFLCIFGRDFGLTWRFRTLTNRDLSWAQAYRVDLLCEFTSCVTPSAVGGSSMGMVFLNTEGIEFGRATTLMMTTLFLDELFFVLFCPIVVALTPAKELFESTGAAFSHGIQFTFWIVYCILFLWTLILFVGIIWKPLWIKHLLSKIFSWKLLRRWQDKADGLAQNMIATSKELKTKPFRFWLEIFGGTALSWISRYLVVNALFLGFLPSDDPHQWIILARQFVLWVVLMVSPTPGGSGLSEWLFSEYYGDLVTVAGMALIMAIFWRIVSYYLYLLIGVVIFPSWLKDAIAKLKGDKKEDTPVSNTTKS